MGRFARIAFSCAIFSFVAVEVRAAGIVDTRHNLSAIGPAGRTIYATTETRICVFCHTPHNATPLTPLWNREIGPKVYTYYTSPTLKSIPPTQPSGATKLCLSCHDGTTAIGAVVNPAGGITMAGGSLPSLSNIGPDLSSHHPVSFSYASALPNAELAPTPPPNLLFGGSDDLECTTCHDPHNDDNGRFLVMDNRFSALCITCHQMSGWAGSGHATSGNPVPDAGGVKLLPVSPKTWPTWPTVGEWGCEVCHTPHFAANPQWLLNYTSSDFCLECHNPTPGAPTPAPHPLSPAAVSALKTSSTVPASSLPAAGRRADIRRQIRKVSSHGGRSGVDDRLHHPKESSRSTVRHVTCVDCHNPHVARNLKASAPDASGAVRGVKGVDRYGIPKLSVTYEYEICFRCHSDYTPDVPYVIRVVNTTNLRLAFDSFNPSFHPVVSVGRNLNIPSIPSSYEPSLNASIMMYCTDCHRDDSGGSKGPHGSSFAPILKERYEITDGTPESLESYILCYRCHERTSILSDVSFRKKTGMITGNGGGHSGHLAKGATCSACHDPHGVNPDNRPSGSHTHLINFDTRVVSPASKTPNSFPVFNDTGTFSGSCTLVCHGVTHTTLSYP